MLTVENLELIREDIWKMFLFFKGWGQKVKNCSFSCLMFREYTACNLNLSECQLIKWQEAEEKIDKFEM